MGAFRNLLGKAARKFAGPSQDEQMLFYASASGLDSLLLNYIERKTDPNARNQLGKTPLHAACEHGEPECAKILLQAGADPDARDLDGNAHCTPQQPQATTDAASHWPMPAPTWKPAAPTDLRPCFAPAISISQRPPAPF